MQNTQKISEKKIARKFHNKMKPIFIQTGVYKHVWSSKNPAPQQGFTLRNPTVRQWKKWSHLDFLKTDKWPKSC